MIEPLTRQELPYVSSLLISKIVMGDISQTGVVLVVYPLDLIQEPKVQTAL